jgi:hypothetical protein
LAARRQANSCGVKLAIVASFTPVMRRYTRKNRPRGFAADAIPKDVLPDA